MTFTRVFGNSVLLQWSTAEANQLLRAWEWWNFSSPRVAFSLSLAIKLEMDKD